MPGENGAPLQMQIGFLHCVSHVEPSKCIYRSFNLDFMDKRVRLIMKSVPRRKPDGFHFQNRMWADSEHISWCIWILHEARPSTSYLFYITLLITDFIISQCRGTCPQCCPCFRLCRHICAVVLVQTPTSKPTAHVLACIVCPQRRPSLHDARIWENVVKLAKRIKLNTSRTSCMTCYMSLFHVDMYGQAVTMMANRRRRQRDSLVMAPLRSLRRRMSYRAVDWLSDRPRRSLQYVDMCK